MHTRDPAPAAPNATRSDWKTVPNEVKFRAARVCGEMVKSLPFDSLKSLRLEKPFLQSLVATAISQIVQINWQ
jgi:hypothetical protein